MESFTHIMVLFSFYTVHYNGSVPAFLRTCYLYQSVCTTIPIYTFFFKFQDCFQSDLHSNPTLQYSATLSKKQCITWREITEEHHLQNCVGEAFLHKVTLF